MKGSHHVKLGILTLATMAALVAIAFGLGIRAMSVTTIEYHSYFDESVQGLEIGSPVDYRGVRIGSVKDIVVAPDHKRVDVALGIDEHHVRRLGLTVVPPDLRAQLGTQGITGVKMVDLNFFDPETNPPPVLSFEPADRYIPAHPSLVKGLADELEDLGQRMPKLLDQGTEVMKSTQAVLDDIHREKLIGRVASAVDQVNGTAEDVRHVVQHVDRARLPERIGSAVEHADGAITKADRVLDGFAGERGLVASVRRAADSVADFGHSAIGSNDELERTIREIGEAARALHELLDEIERDPDMLVKGRARTDKP